ncbi:hypothetical protein PQX77_021164 [Marasmius sp. AFHP31]|nr:hypothetical protein PQX77_021164 [Marasmius sp. AFHP31]
MNLTDPFISRNRCAILDSKKDKRVEEKRVQQQHEIKERKKRCEQRKRTGTENENVEKELPSVTRNPVEVERELEGRFKLLKQQYQNQVQPNHQRFLDQLSVQALRWKESTRGTLMSKNLDPSPAFLAKKSFDSMRKEYYMIESEYPYCLRDQKGRGWEGKRGEFTAFKEVLSTLIEVLDNIHESLGIEGYNPDADELRELYKYKY